MIFHENRLLAYDSHEISYLFFQKSQNLSFAAVVNGALRVKRQLTSHTDLQSSSILTIFSTSATFMQATG